MRQIRKSDKNKHYAWVVGADMYLATAVILSKVMQETYRLQTPFFNNIQQIDKKCGFTSANPDYEMLLPLIFNLKHGIELYLKALIMQINPRLEYPEGHDLIDLLNCLISGVEEKKQDSPKLELLDTNLRKIIEKYYFGLYAFSKVKVKPDKNNEAERYPEHRNGSCYKIDKLDSVNMSDLLLEVEKDCVELQKQFRENILKKI